MVRLERNLYGHPLAGLLWERQFEEILLELGWENVPTQKQPWEQSHVSLEAEHSSAPAGCARNNPAQFYRV